MSIWIRMNTLPIYIYIYGQVLGKTKFIWEPWEPISPIKNVLLFHRKCVIFGQENVTFEASTF